MGHLVNEVNNSSSPTWGHKPYRDNPPLVNYRTDPMTIATNRAGFDALAHTDGRPYVPTRGDKDQYSPYPDGQPANPLAARRAGSTPLAFPYVVPFENWINNAKRVFGVFMPWVKR